MRDNQSQVIVNQSVDSIIKYYQNKKLFQMDLQNNSQFSESSNQLNTQKESISYSRLAAEVDLQDTQKEKPKDNEGESNQKLLNPHQNQHHQPISRKPQERELSHFSEDGPRILINYFPSEVGGTIEKDSNILMMGSKNSPFIRSNQPTRIIPDLKTLMINQLRSITQTETQHKRSEEEANQPKTIIESQIKNHINTSSLHMMINTKNSLLINKNPFQPEKGFTQSEFDGCIKRQLDDSVEIVPNSPHLETEKLKIEQQNPIKTSKTNRTSKQSDKRIYSSLTTASKIVGKRDDYAKLVQTVQNVEAKLMTLSGNKKSLRQDYCQSNRYLYGESPSTPEYKNRRRIINLQANNKSHILSYSKSLQKIPLKQDAELKQIHYWNKQLDRLIQKPVWNTLLSPSTKSSSQLDSCLVYIAKLLKLSSKYIIHCEEPFTVLYDNDQMVQISYSKKIYIGQYKFSKRCFIKHGSGRQIDPFRSIYQGFFENGMKEGLGTSMIVDKYTYYGQWKSSVMEGRGILQTKGNSLYQGEFMNGKKHGYGVEQLRSGDRYEGQFQNNVFHGKGQYFWKNGAKYRGDFMNGQMHGFGKWISEKGDKYEGYFINGKKEGNGVYSWKNGKKYQGEFKNGNRKNAICTKSNPHKETCDIFFEKRFPSPKRFKIYF